MKQIVLALQNYHDTYQVFPPAYFTDATGKPAHSWRVLILPYMEQKLLYDRYRFDEPWDGPNNTKLHGEIVQAYQCPSDTNPIPTETSYLAVIGKAYFFTGPTSRTMAQVTDGTAFTLAIVEVKHSGIHWMEPRDLHELQMAQIVNAPPTAKASVVATPTAPWAAMSMDTWNCSSTASRRKPFAPCSRSLAER